MQRHEKGDSTTVSEASRRVKVTKCNQGMWTPADFESHPGTYALLLLSAADAVIKVGRLGSMQLQPGFYVYVGSALGPGGVRARLAHQTLAMLYIEFEQRGF